MKLLKTETMHWWDIGLVKFSVLCIGIAIGANWPEVFGPYSLVLFVTGVVVGLYIFYSWFKK